MNVQSTYPKKRSLNGARLLPCCLLSVSLVASDLREDRWSPLEHQGKGEHMYLLELFRNETRSSNRGWLLSCLLISGLGLSACAGDSSEGQEEEDSAQESDEDDDDNDDSSDPEDSQEESEEQESEEDEPSEGDDEDSPGDDENPKEEESNEKDPDKEEDPENEGSKKEDPEGGGEGEGGSKRDCEKIQWGSGGVKKGQVVPRDNQKGYVDKDGDGKVETEETEVGMCQLHLSKKRCGLVMTGFKG